MTKSTATRERRKSVNGWAKPYGDFPLCYHPPSGRLYKKIRGKRIYFGYAKDWQAAVDLYLEQKDDLHAGRTPRKTTDGLTLRDLCNRFLTSKQKLLDSGEITSRTFADYKRTTDRLISVFGTTRLVDDLAADDFEQLRADIAKSCGPVSLGNEITRTRVVFNYAYQNGLIDKPIRYGTSFKRPSKKTLRKQRQKNGKRLFEAVNILAMIDKANTQQRAMILLGINAGFGNADCGMLPLSAVDLESGWIDFPRPKTGIDRRCPLWPETIKALREAIESRPKPMYDADAGLVFITSRGQSWSKETSDNPVAKETRKLLDELGIHRPGLGFYALRHTFRTIADATRDFPAARLIMGHADDSIDAHYREHIDDDRLRAVTEYVRAWLFGSHDKTE